MAQHVAHKKRAFRGDRMTLVAFIGISVSLVFVATGYYQLALSTAALFVLIQLGGTYCVGRLILHVSDIDNGLPGSADVLALSYLLGYAASIVAYVLLFLFAPHRYIAPLYLGISIAALSICIALAIRNRTSLYEIDPTLKRFIVFSVVLLAVYTFTFILPNRLPTTEPNGYYLDNMFWVGNNVELTYSIPPDNFRNIFAPDIRYHYLSSIRMALIQTVLDVPAFEACFAFSPFDLTMLLSSAGVMFVQEFSGTGELEGHGLPQSLAVFLLLFSTGAERLTSMSFLSHLYVASFGFAESFAGMLVFMALAKRYWERGSLTYQEALVCSLVLAFCMGNKGAFGFVCLVVTFVLCFTSLFVRKRTRFALLFGLSVLAAGLVMYFGLLSDGIWRNVGETSNVRSLLSFPRVQAMRELAESLPIPHVLQECLFLGSYVLASHPIMYGLAIAAFVKSTIRHEFDALDAALWLAAGVCIAILRLVPTRGFSQSYFYMATIPLVWGYVVRRLTVPPRLRSRTAIMVSCFVTIISSAILCYQLWLPKLTVKSLLYLAQREVPQQLLAMGGFNDNVVTPEVYEALLWVRENLPRDELYYSEAQSANSYYAGSFSERHVVRPWGLFGVEPGDEIPLLSEGSKEALDRCRLEGVVYAIQIENKTRVEDLFPNDVRLLFRNDEASVYLLVY